jgi:hypothetical protein
MTERLQRLRTALAERDLPQSYSQPRLVVATLVVSPVVLVHY